jgi:hypothetical protein
MSTRFDVGKVDIVVVVLMDIVAVPDAASVLVKRPRRAARDRIIVEFAMARSTASSRPPPPIGSAEHETARPRPALPDPHPEHPGEPAMHARITHTLLKSRIPAARRRSKTAEFTAANNRHAASPSPTRTTPSSIAPGRS